MVLAGPTELIQIEIERALVDAQAQIRAAQLKRDALAARETRPVRLVIAVRDSATARRRLAPVAALIATAFPATSRDIWRALRTGVPLKADGVLFVRAGRSGTPRP